MKKTSILFILLLIGSLCLNAQTKTLIYGNLGVENVNISVLNTPYGTSSNAEGHYELPLFDKSRQVNLYFSCIGYQDTVIQITPMQLENDTVNVSFNMQKQDYNLQEVGVTANRDFYRSNRGRNIADVAFLNDNIYLLENTPRASSIVVLDLEGVEIARTDYDILYEKLHVDAFNDMILVGQDSCLQVYLDEKQDILPISSFSRDDYRNKLLKVVCEFNGAYIIRTIVHDRGLYWIKYDHGKSQDFYYVMKDGSVEGPQYLCSLLDTVGYNTCQSYWMNIQTEYHQSVMEDEGIDIINNGTWDGNLTRLAETSSLLAKIQWYCSIVAKKEYSIVPLVFNNALQFVGVDNRVIVEIGRDFKIAARRSLLITSGENLFKNEFLKDEATGKTYGLFVNDGVNYIGLYDPISGTVGMEQKASNGIYPRVFKMHGGYAYSVFYDSGRNQGVLNRMRIEP